MVYKDLPSLIKRITEVKELKFQSLVVVIGYFLSLLHSALFSGKFSLVIVAITNFIWGISVLIHKKAFNEELNMGTEKFIYGTFEHFLSRYPSDAELAEATKIVDGLIGVLFFEIGTSKQDFMDIFFASEDYYGGQVKIVVEGYLFRSPTTEESAYYTTYYKNTGDYKGLLKKVLTTDEYVGVN